VKVRDVDVLHCGAGWRVWSFVKLTTEDGLVGYAECTESFGSRRGIEAVVRELAPLVVGKDARPIERRLWELEAATRQSPGGVVQKAIAGIENALLDLKGKALGVPVYELFGGPLRDDVGVYWSHCGTSRVRAHELVGENQVRTYDDLTELAREVVARGFSALKTNVLVLGDEPFVYMPGFNRTGGGPDLPPDRELLAALRRSVAALREGVPSDFELIVDLNFNFRPEGYQAAAKALEELDLAWLELDIFNPQVLRDVKESVSTPLCSGENLYGIREYLPFITQRSMDIVSIDVPWNGFSRSLEVARLADAYGLTVTPHNYYSHLSTFMSAHFSAMAPNVRLLEVDIDDVPWKDVITTATPAIEGGRLAIPTGPGWGVDLDEDALREHPPPANR
jgi:L-alanine-DL-glutamate epimerase-like enolase superfamily enzyme